MPAPIENTEDWTPEDQRQKISELDDNVVVCFFISLCLQIKDVTGYSISYVRTIFTYIGIIFTCGLLRLVFHWFPHWMLMCMNKECALIKAEKILVKVIVCPRFLGFMSLGQNTNYVLNFSCRMSTVFATYMTWLLK